MRIAPTTTRPVPLLLALAGALFALGCQDDAGSNPEADATTPPCTPGTIGCACDDGACTAGRCADGVCVDCPEGTLRCPCGPGEACAAGLVCEQELCAEDACPAGSLDCPCDVGETCDEGLSCMDSTCLPVPECPEGVLDCPCGDGPCEDALVCINDVCRDCPADTVGCPCADGACLNGLVCALGACREAVGCADAGCAPFQRCEEAADGSDARCLEECDEGFGWDAATETCVELPPTCGEGVNSIAAECAGQNRTCVEGADGAACGPCLPGNLEDAGVCRPDERANCGDDPDDAHSILIDCEQQQRTCVERADGASCGECLGTLIDNPVTGTCLPAEAFPLCDAQAECADGLVCSAREPAGDAHCLPAACGAGETFDLRAGACTDRCNCQGPGQTGNPWPVTDWNGDCVCETEPGFFFNVAAGSRRAEACDADGDGWTRRSAFAHIESPDEAVRLNARCPLRTVDRFVLVNEAGQQLELSVDTLSNGLARFEPLYETDESDDEAEAAERQGEAYGDRRFHAAELNPLTKACVSALDDFNHNGISDLREHHRAAPAAQRAWMATFVAASYFVELSTGHFEPPAAGEAHGHYVIAERSRCAGAVAVGYPDDEGPYGDACWRRRDGGYVAREPVGYDFQRWSCAEPDGACGAQPPPAPLRSEATLPAHGTCDDVEAEHLGAWRGMGHGSQFKCVEIVEDQAPRVEAFQRRRSSLRLDDESAGRNTLNACGLVSCAAGDPDCVEFEPAAVAVNPAAPAITCETDPELAIGDRQALVGRVGFVALRFESYDRAAAYTGGCIDEAAEWDEICPGFDPAAPGASIGIGNPNDFGKLLCGCGLNYGGPECDRGCPDDQLHFGGTAPLDRPGCFDGYCVAAPDDTGLDGGRLGFWMCGELAASGFVDVDPDVGLAFQAEGALGPAPDAPRGVITVRGHIPTFGTDGTPMCERLDDEGRCVGLTLR